MSFIVIIYIFFKEKVPVGIMWFDKTQTMKPQGTLFLIYLTSVSPFYSAAPRFEYPIRSSSTSRAAFLPSRIAHTTND